MRKDHRAALENLSKNADDFAAPAPDEKLLCDECIEQEPTFYLGLTDDVWLAYCHGCDGRAELTPRGALTCRDHGGSHFRIADGQSALDAAIVREELAMHRAEEIGRS